MGGNNVTDRVKTTARTRADSNAGPFGGGATKVADVGALKSLIEMTAREEDFEADRKTREVDPAQFRALLRGEAGNAAPAPVAQPEPEPTPEASFDDGLDAAFADPDAGREPEPEAVTQAATEAETDEPTKKQHVDAPDVTVRAPELAPALPATRSSSTRMVVLLALLAVVALAAVLAVTLT